jgi:hypothetical protein
LIVAHPVSGTPSVRRPRTRPEDRSLVAELTRWHQRTMPNIFTGVSRRSRFVSRDVCEVVSATTRAQLMASRRRSR